MTPIDFVFAVLLIGTLMAARLKALPRDTTDKDT